MSEWFQRLLNCYSYVYWCIFQIFFVRDQNTCTLFFFYHGATAPSGPGPPHYRCFTIILRHATFGRTPLDKRSARHRDLYLTTHDTHNRQTDKHDPGGIRNHNPNKREAADQLLKPRGHWDRPRTVLLKATAISVHINFCTYRIIYVGRSSSKVS